MDFYFSPAVWVSQVLRDIYKVLTYRSNRGGGGGGGGESVNYTCWDVNKLYGCERGSKQTFKYMYLFCLAGAR